MRYIAHLDLAINRSLQGRDWCELARNIGTPLLDYQGPLGPEPIADFIRGAVGMVLPYENFLNTPELVEAIRDRLDHGCRLLVTIGPNSVDSLNPFLYSYGIQGTRIALHDQTGERLVELNRKESPDWFAPHQLLEGVKSLVLALPNVIRYSGATTPILTLPAERFLTIDQESDFPADWTSRKLSCFVLARLPDSGGILATSGSFFAGDPFTSVMGREFPGITGASNKILAENVLRWLAGQAAKPSDAVQAYESVDSIERLLVEFVVQKLNRVFADWWTDGVPQPVRVKCAQRCEEEGNKLPKGAFLDLVDVKAIIEKNWKDFEADLRKVGWVGGKVQALSWFSEFNEIRRSVMHPTRRFFQPRLVDDSSISKLKEWLGRVERLGIHTTTIQ